MKLLVKLDDRGQTLVVVALVMVALVAMAGLVLDGGQAYVQRRCMQNAADAAALAAARELSLGGSQADAQAVVEEYAVTRNGADPDPTLNISADLHEVEVITSRKFDTWFALVVGLSEMEVRARAVARWDLANSGHLAPIAIFDRAMPALGHTVVIWDSDKDIGGTDDIAGANRGWLGLGCPFPSSCEPSNSELKEWMRDGYPNWIEVGADFMGYPGTKAASIHEAWVGQTIVIPVYDSIYHYTKDTKCNPDHPGCAICVSEVGGVPCADLDPQPTECKKDKCCCTKEAYEEGHCDALIWEVYTLDSELWGRYYYHIVSLAGFEVINPTLSGPYKGIQGEFLETVEPGEAGTPVGGDYGVRMVRLID